MFNFLRSLAPKRAPLSAHEAAALARDALMHGQPQTAPPALFCVYAAPDDSNRALERDGRSGAWHVDFFDEREGVRRLVRVLDGRTKVRTMRHDRRPTEYVYACAAPEACAVPDGWVDSPVAAAEAGRSLAHALRDVPKETLDDYLMLAVMLPAQALRYVQENQPVSLPPPPESPCYAILWGHIDVEDHDALAVYIDAVRGEEVACARFRFRPYVMPGMSRDW